MVLPMNDPAPTYGRPSIVAAEHYVVPAGTMAVVDVFCHRQDERATRHIDRCDITPVAEDRPLRMAISPAIWDRWLTMCPDGLVEVHARESEPRDARQ